MNKKHIGSNFDDFLKDKEIDTFEKFELQELAKIIDCKNGTILTMKAENERLKKEVEIANREEVRWKSNFNNYKDVFKKQHDILFKYKQALEDVRDCINVLSTVDNDFKGSMVEWKINKIINEVLKSENHKQADS